MADGAELPVFHPVWIIVRALGVAQKKNRCDLRLRPLTDTSSHPRALPWMVEGLSGGGLGAGPVAGKPVGNGVCEEQDRH